MTNTVALLDSYAMAAAPVMSVPLPEQVLTCAPAVLADLRSSGATRAECMVTIVEQTGRSTLQSITTQLNDAGDDVSIGVVRSGVAHLLKSRRLINIVPGVFGPGDSVKADATRGADGKLLDVPGPDSGVSLASAVRIALCHTPDVVRPVEVVVLLNAKGWETSSRCVAGPFRRAMKNKPDQT